MQGARYKINVIYSHDTTVLNDPTLCAGAGSHVNMEDKTLPLRWMQALVLIGCRSPSNTREVQATFNLSWSDRKVTNKHQRQPQGSFHCKFFANFFNEKLEIHTWHGLWFWQPWLPVGWDHVHVCSLVATSGSQCNTTGVRVGCWSITPDNLSKVLSTFRSLPSSMAILSSHGMQSQITSNPEQPTIQLSSSYIKLPPQKNQKKIKSNPMGLINPCSLISL